MTPVAFGVVFALTASVGPIIGQNYGAKLMERVQRTLTDSFILSIGYVLFAWAVLALAEPALIAAFEAKGESAQYIAFYCRYGVVAWVFLACLFVANVSFNNLGFPVLSMAFNWARATLGTIPFVTVGARYGGVQGGMLGFALGAACVRVDRRRDGLCGDVAARQGDGRRERFAATVAAGARKRPEEGPAPLRKGARDTGEARAQLGSGRADCTHDHERDERSYERILDRRHSLATEHEPAQ